MNKIDATKSFEGYLKSHFISYFKEETDNNAVRLTMCYKGYDICPGNALESCIYFYEDCFEAKVYYSALGSSICKNSKFQDELYRFLNYLNYSIWPRAVSDLYEPCHLYTPRFIKTEDGNYDITASFVASYDIYNLAQLETEDFITKALPELLNKISPALFLVIAGEITVENAIAVVKKEVLHEKI